MKPSKLYKSVKVLLYSALTASAWREDLSRALLHGRYRRSASSRTYDPRSRHFLVRGGNVADLVENSEESHQQREALVTKTPYIVCPPIWAQEKRVLLLMDIFANYHGLYLSHRAKEAYGVATVVVFSDYMKGYFLKQNPEDLDQLLSMCMPPVTQSGQDQRELEEWCRSLVDYELVGIACESDSGLADAERLGDALNLTYHDGVNEARRDKFLMNQAVSKAGLPVVRQRLCRSASEARDFGMSEMGMVASTSTKNSSMSTENFGTDNNCLVVVKPIRGVASDDVFLCHDINSIDEAFSKIHGSTVFGSPREKHDTVLAQEFAVGQEYAIDIISKNGQHKIAAIWKYDKRPANGASFVYYATKLYDDVMDNAGDKAVSAALCDYAKHCLDALGIRWGLTHNEFILTADGPRLVEVNRRQHNMDFIPITMECIGYNAFDMLLAAYLGGNDPTTYPPHTEDQRLDWDALPDMPALKTHGAMIHLVNYADGTLASVNEVALMEIQNMESVIDLEVYASFLEIGEQISPTTDIRSDAGWVQLVNDDKGAFQRDYDRIIELMPTLFQIEVASN